MLIGVIAEELLLSEPSAVVVAEAASAADVFQGNVIFPRLVDEPVSALDTWNAYLGEIMLEAATAADTANAGVAYGVAIVEAATAGSAEDATLAGGAITGSVDEAATAASVEDATVTSAAVVRSAMITNVFINSGTSREANANGIMVNV